MSGITLSDLIVELEKIDGNKIVKFGFGEPMSYRGYYEDLAFTPERDVKISDMLNYAKSALGKTFTGYKGGEYKMEDWTDCYIAEYGTSYGDMIGPTLMSYWQAEE